MEITNPKVKSMIPEWAPFKGFSLLFDNPNESALYDTICDISDILTPALKGFSFCPLPRSSYHITVWDGINDGNLSQISSENQYRFKQLLENKSNSILDGLELQQVTDMEPITFEVEKFTIWSNFVLVAKLKPATLNDERVYESFVEKRMALINRFKVKFGFNSTRPFYEPHISIGYFANITLAGICSVRDEQINELFLHQLVGKTIQFKTCSLYGFYEMAHFNKLTV
jgi:hypothetical protein